MIPDSDSRRYAVSAAALLLLAGGLLAAAVRPAPARPDLATHVHLAVAPMAGQGLLPTAAATSRPPARRAPGTALAEARARLRRGGRGPSAEVDRWAVRLSSDKAGSHSALARYAVYRHLIEETLRKYRLPLDLAFVPWVESEWRNDTASVAGADGMWQFMPATGRGYGLEISTYVDERRDPIRATDAAARHMADLFRETGDWHAALAAYNAGLGRARHTSDAFWNRRHSLPSETRAYVPRILAAAQVGRDPEAWGLHPRARPPLRFREIPVDGGTSLDVVARRVGAEAAVVRALNPHLVRGITPPGRPWRVRIPFSTTRTP